MKEFVNLVFGCLLVLSHSITAQVASAALDLDPAFREVATHRIQYPAKPATQAIYGRFYTRFRIDEKGHIQDIAVLYPKLSTRVSKQYGFEAEILKGLKQMPPLRPNLTGNYVLPVAFCFTNYLEGPNPIVPTDTLPASLVIADRIALQEIRIYGQSPSSNWMLKGFPASRQIGR